MNFVVAFLAITFLSIILIPLVKGKTKAVVVYFAILLNAFISGYFAIQTFLGHSYEIFLPGGLVMGDIPLRLDPLSGWFILIINFIFITGGFYGLFYMRSYEKLLKSLSLHGVVFILLHSSLISLCLIQNGFAFLIAWEVMTLAGFVAIIFEHEKASTIKAGLNYLIYSHVSILFLMLGFIWAVYKTGSYDFQIFGAFAAAQQDAATMILFLTFFVGFAIKAGFAPFHSWLPYAHPAAPAHISGIMSGVLIKIGIYGILRMLWVIKPDFTIIGYIILLVSVLSGLYGVMLAIVQHNLKRLLAYHTIENIGIIGIGIGIGSIGLGSGNNVVAALGFAGALLHTWNHALFKSLLFFAAGNIYQVVHHVNIEHLGGLIKKMPQTAFLFLIAALAISGLPPFNGFISEFILYNSLYLWIQEAGFFPLIAIVFSILGLVLIGGLAILCFTKAFGVVFLGGNRQPFVNEPHEVSIAQLIPMYLIAFLIVMIGLFPGNFMNLLIQPVALITNNPAVGTVFKTHSMDVMKQLSWAAGGFILLVISIFLIRKLIVRKPAIAVGPTWGCGYVAPDSGMQYTASSFVRSYTKLFKPVLMLMKKQQDLQGVFPSEGQYETHPYDKIEKWFVDRPIVMIKSVLNRFVFLQNGKLQFYILYGILFIVSIICIPIIYNIITMLLDYFKQI